VRRKREHRPRIPARFLRYRPDEWPGGPEQWVREREAWARAQPPIVTTGTDAYGTPWRCVVTPLGDRTDMMRARREARLTAFADVDSG